MEKVNTTNTTTDIFVDGKNVGNFTLTTFNNGTMNANFMINDASTFHGSPEAAQDLVNLVNDSISQSKALTTIKVNQKVGHMHLETIATVLSIIGVSVVGGLSFLIKLLKDSIMTPINHSIDTLNVTIKGLREDLNESNVSRKEHEKKLFDNLDEHTKQIYLLDGRVKTLETINQIEKEEK